MKKQIILISAIAMAFFSTTNSQSVDDAMRFNQHQVTGTARSMAMGNAFGALGGDLSAISINPAGVAVYRSSEFVFTPGISFDLTKAKYGSLTNENDKYSFPFNQIGAVTTYRPLREKEKGLVSTHFAFTYNRVADFNRNTKATVGENVAMDNSLMDALRRGADGYSPDDMPDKSWLAWQTYILDTIPFINTWDYWNTGEGIDENNMVYSRAANGFRQMKQLQTEGYAGEYGVTFGANVSQVLLIGASLNFYSMRYREYSGFREINAYGLNEPGANDPVYVVSDLDYFDSYSNLSQDGFGINGKFGMILNLNPIRFGASFQLPTFYSFDETYQFGMDSYFLNRTNYSEKSILSEQSYNYRTPYKATGSFAFVIGKTALLSVDYEYTDHSYSKYTKTEGSDTFFDNLNKQIKETFEATHNVRAGLEMKPSQFFAVRAGAAYIDSPLKGDLTDNKPVQYQLSGGFGIRSNNFFFDAGYRYTFFERDYYVAEEDLEFMNAVILTSMKHHASFSFGWKF